MGPALDLRPQLERLDRLILRSEGIDPGALTFAFRPLWRLDAPAQAALALTKAQATQVYAGLKLWPADVVARLAEAQLVADGTYPNAAAVFAEGAARAEGASPTLDYDPTQPRDLWGRWTGGESGTAPSSMPAKPEVAPDRPASNKPDGILGFLSALNPIGTAQAQQVDPAEEENRDPRQEDISEPGSVLRISRYRTAEGILRTIDPNNRELGGWSAPGYIPTEADIERIEGAARDVSIKRTCDFMRPDGHPIGAEGTSPGIRVLPGGLVAAQPDFDYLSVGGTNVPFAKGSMVRLPYGAGTITFRPVSSTPGSPAIDVNIPGVMRMKLHC